MKINDFSNFVRVVVLDDVKKEGTAIKLSLENIGIPSIFYHIISNRILPKQPHKNVRLVFLDLIFGDTGGATPELNAGNAISKLSKIIGKTGFYILVIWSSHTTEDVASIFEEQLKRQNVFAKPYRLLKLQKSRFKTGKDNYRMREIIKELDRQISTTPSLEIFLMWEKIATDSISVISGDISAQKSQQDLSRTINSLAEAYGGKVKGKDKPKSALMTFNEVFRGFVSERIMSSNFGNFYRKIDVGNLDETEKAKLNSLLMFLPDNNIGPGSIFKIRQFGMSKNNFIKNILAQSKTTLGNAYTKITPIAIEVTPLCNAAQKNGNHTYFLNGLMHPKFYTASSGGLKEIKIQSGPHCYMLEKHYWNNDHNEIFVLSFNLKLFHSTILKEYIALNIKLRDNLVIDLQHEVSGYLSRPGHILL